jgi:zinc protease
MSLVPTRALLAGALAFALALPAAASEPSRIFDLPYQMRELGNGLRVIVVPTDTPGVVSLQIPVQTGSRNEVEKGKSGFAHFFEHMMFRGTERHPPELYQAIVKNAGGDQNAYTSADLTNYHINFTTDDLEKIIEIEADRFQHLLYTEEQFRTEALAVKGEYLKNFSNPMSKGFEKLSEIAFDVHTYGHTTMGYFADIEDMPNQMEYSKLFFDRWYRPEYSAVIVVGDVEVEPTMALVEKHWGGWQRGSYSVDIPQDGPLQGPRYAHIAWEGPTLPLMLHAWRGPAMTTEAPDTAALMLLSEIYFGQTSEVFQQLVVRERKADQFFAMAPRNKDPGLFTIGARLTAPEHAAAVVDAIQTTLLRARTELLDPARLAETKSRSKYGFAATLNSAASIGAVLAQFVHYERDPETLNRLYQQFDRVTPEDIRAAANAVFIDSNRASVSIANGETLAGADGFRPLDAEAASRLAADTSKPHFELVERPSDSALIDVALIVSAGSMYDPPGKNGLAQLTAAMVTQAGTVKRSFAEVQQGFYPLAAGWGAQLDQEIVKLAGSVHRDNSEAWYALVRELLLEPGFREDDFARLKTQLVNGIRQNLRANNDEELGKEALYEMVYGPNHPYGRLPTGWAGEIEALTLDDVRAFHREHYRQGAITVGLGGGYDAPFRSRLLADLARLPEGKAARPAVTAPKPAKARSARIIEKETPAVAVSFGWPIDVRRGHPDWAALWLVRSYLGEHRNSSALLYQRIREVRGMNYGNYAYTEYFPNGMYLTQPNPNYPRQNDLFQIWLRPLRDNNDALFATRAALFEIDRLRREGISVEDFEATRTYLRKYVALLTATSGRRLGYALDAHWFGTDDFVDYVRSELEKLSHRQVNAAIRKYLDASGAQFVFVAKDAEGLAAAIAEDRASPISYNTDKPAELLAEDAEIAKLPLRLPRERLRILKAETVFE